MNEKPVETSASQRKRIDNELKFRRENEQMKKLVAPLMDDEAKTLMPVSFACECSRLDCTETVEIPVEEFTLVHQYRDRFVVKRTHEQADIEKVVQLERGYVIVEKMALSA